MGYDAIIETSCPHVVAIRDCAAIGMRFTRLRMIVNSKA
jgi:hypothetical protein